MTIGTKTLSLFKLISLGLILVCFIMMFLPWMTMKGGAFGINATQSQNLFAVSGGGCFWTVMLSIFEILFFLAIVVAAAGILTDRTLWVLPVAALAVLMFLFDLFAVIWTKNQVNDAFGGYGSYLSDYGVSYSVHVGVGAWLFLLFGLAAYGVLFYEERSSGRDPFDRAQLSTEGMDLPDLAKGKLPDLPKVNLGGLGGWTCPNCGASLGGGQKFCDRCGTKKPEPPRCPGCGRLIKSGEIYCSNCGTKL